ncbi:MAG: leucine-rich repeat domain-containing protein [Treponema sp.]|nr:leucine-rich repeat domain-containing protein [Treponema sp.]
MAILEENGFVAETCGKTASIKDYNRNNTDITIQDKVKGYPVDRISNKAFCNKNLTAVTIPDGIIQIGDRAFADNQLTSIKIPDSVSDIHNDAFANNKITSIEINNKVKIHGNGGFCSRFVEGFNLNPCKGTYTLNGNNWTFVKKP